MTHSNRSGFSLLEMTMVTAILAAVSGVLFTIASAMTRSAQSQEAVAIVRDDGRNAMQYIVRSLRMAWSATIVDTSDEGLPLGADPVAGISFQRVQDSPEDVGGAEEESNGLAVNRDMSVGLSDPIVIQLDTGDINNDGLSDTQLVETIGGEFSRVIANYISPVFVDEGNPDSWFNAPLGGVVFQEVDAGIQVTVITRKRAGSAGETVVNRLDQVVRPLN